MPGLQIIEEVGVILDSDPRKARAFEIEKYATYAGLSQNFIQRGINAVNNDDWDAQKNIYNDIVKGLSKNPNWVVDVKRNDFDNRSEDKLLGVGRLESQKNFKSIIKALSNTEIELDLVGEGSKKEALKKIDIKNKND
mgnify:CR=1 FL=1